MNEWEEQATLGGMLNRASQAQHRLLGTPPQKRSLAVRAIAGIDVPPSVVGAVRGFLVAAFTTLGEVVLTHFGVIDASWWQASLPALAAAWFVLVGALDQWSKPGQNAT